MTRRTPRGPGAGARLFGGVPPGRGVAPARGVGSAGAARRTCRITGP